MRTEQVFLIFSFSGSAIRCAVSQGLSQGLHKAHVLLVLFSFFFLLLIFFPPQLMRSKTSPLCFLSCTPGFLAVSSTFYSSLVLHNQEYSESRQSLTRGY